MFWRNKSPSESQKKKSCCSIFLYRTQNSFRKKELLLSIKQTSKITSDPKQVSSNDWLMYRIMMASLLFFFYFFKNWSRSKFSKDSGKTKSALRRDINNWTELLWPKHSPTLLKVTQPSGRLTLKKRSDMLVVCWKPNAGPCKQLQGWPAVNCPMRVNTEMFSSALLQHTNASHSDRRDRSGS